MISSICRVCVVDLSAPPLVLRLMHTKSNVMSGLVFVFADPTMLV